MALEVATSAYPAYFLVLAGAGNFTKALGKGMGRPVFRVIQTHFAAAGNVGAVGASQRTPAQPASARSSAPHVARRQLVHMPPLAGLAVCAPEAWASSCPQVAAKEEVWEVTGQLAGYAASVVLLKALEGAGGVDAAAACVGLRPSLVHRFHPFSQHGMGGSAAAASRSDTADFTWFETRHWRPQLIGH
jgi:hypothetical protein